MSASETHPDPELVRIDPGEEDLMSLVKFVDDFDGAYTVLGVRDGSLRFAAINGSRTIVARTPEIDVEVDGDGDVFVSVPAGDVRDALDWSVDPTLVIDRDDDELSIMGSYAQEDNAIGLDEPPADFNPDTPAQREQYDDVQATVPDWRFIGAAKTVAAPSESDVRLTACASEIKLEGGHDGMGEGWSFSRFVGAEYSQRPGSIHDTTTLFGPNLLIDAVSVLPCEGDLDLDLYWSQSKPLTMIVDGYEIVLAPRIPDDDGGDDVE